MTRRNLEIEKPREGAVLEFKWTVSRGRESYGYNICTLRVDGQKVSSCNGGGYDMKGTSLGSWVARAFTAELLKLKSKDMPEQSHWQPDYQRICDGDCRVDYQDRLIRANSATKNGFPITATPLPKLPEDCYECPTCKGPTRQSQDGSRIDDGRYFYGLRFHDPNYDPLSAKLERCDDTFTTPEDVGKTFRQLQKEGKIVNLDVLRTWYKASSPHATKRHVIPRIDGACGFSSVQTILKAIGYDLEHVSGHSRDDTYILRKVARKRHGNTGRIRTAA